MATLLLDKYGWPVEQIIGRPFTNFVRNLIHGRKRTCKACWERSRSAVGAGPAQSIEVGNVLICRDDKFGHHRYFEVLGVYLGSVNEESLIELRNLGEKPGHDGDTLRPTTFVPECMTRNLEVRSSAAELVS